MTSPGLAFCCSLAATFMVSPLTSRCSVERSPATTSPVFTPMRCVRMTPRRGSRARLSSTRALCMSQAARSAPKRGAVRVADDLVAGPAMPLDDQAHALEVALEDLPEGLGVQPFGHGCRANHVGKDCRHGFAGQGEAGSRLRHVGIMHRGTTSTGGFNLPFAAHYLTYVHIGI